jgi:ABC-type multidrug transport system ATPase subunit
MSENVIEVANLTKRYDGTAVVKGVSFSVARGEIFGLLGPNGAGKTTTILMLLGLSEISDGQARVLGHDPVRDPLAVKRRVGYLPDQVGFYDNLTAADNLRYTARLMGIGRAEREEKIHSALAHVGLPDVADQRVATFSRGMRQRLGIAEILMKEAEIAILDEPTSGLDPQAMEAEGQGLEERLAAVAGVQRVESAGPNRWRLTSERDVRPEAAAAVVGSGARLLRMSVEEPSLEAIYTRYFETHEGQRHAA